MGIYDNQESIHSKIYEMTDNITLNDDIDKIISSIETFLKSQDTKKVNVYFDYDSDSKGRYIVAQWVDKSNKKSNICIIPILPY